MPNYKKLCDDLRDDKFKFDEGYPSYDSFKTTRDCEEAADAIEALQAEIERLRVQVDEQCDRCSNGMDKLEAQLESEIERLKKELDAAIDLAGKLTALCNPPREMEAKLFRPHINRPGDYMGTGYDFLDGYNRIFDEFEQTADDELYGALRAVVNAEIVKWRGVQEAHE